ncbi:MAG: helix-turn-helix domain-containing protein [Acidobacteriota bacterium]|nr:helix-turn-helix domain-containing protein [Acidobacteriota bacterium]
MSFNESRHQKRIRMFNLIESYHSSGKTQKEFCRENNINYSTFQSWLRKYRLRNQTVKTHEDSLAEKGFVPLKFSPSPDRPLLPQNGFAIEYPNGVRLFLGTDPDVRFIKELLKLQVF